ncbi:MAG: TIGR03984 family CRISPR-associated protein [Ignavibacteria bacterium]|nr:TIGR03984 family CRISPR-associated protein [Ignavibacteria bacterium]
MENGKTKNGLKLIQLKSSVKNDYGVKVFTEFIELEKFLADNFSTNGFMIAYLDYKVIIRKYENSKIVFWNNEEPFSPEFIQKLRLFNDKRELFIWRNEGKWKAKLRIDEEGEEVSTIESNQVLFGTVGNIENGFTILTEDRGTEIILPFEIKGIDTKKNRVKIKTRNYINYNELGQAGYGDCRFVEFTLGIENKTIGGN